MKIIVYLVEKTKDVDFSEYLKRISAFAKLEVREINDIDAERMKKMDGYKVLLDEKGDQMTSQGFSEFLGGFKDRGETLNFVVGGPYGFADEVKEEADKLLSFSKMTFTHQMIRLFLFEQIYRGLSIIHGKMYHNE